MMDTTSLPLVKPFKGERFAAVDAMSNLISPPYDVISDRLRDELLERHPHNIVRLILPDGNGNRYDNAAALARQWRRDGTLVSDSEAGVYIMQQTFATPDGRRFTRSGLIAALAAEPYAGGRVRPHEKTHKGPKEDRLALMRSTDTMFEALLMLAPDEDRALLQAMLDEVTVDPLVEASIDGVDLKLWFVSGENGETIAKLAGRSDIYIADGHHRYETAVAYRKENRHATHTLALIVPQSDPGLVVLPTHRVLHGSPVTLTDVAEFLDESWEVTRLAPEADVSATAVELDIGCIVVCADGAAVCRERRDVTLARVGANLDERVQSLNIARVDAMVTAPLKRLVEGDVTYSPDASEVIRKVQSEAAAGVLVPATTVEEVLGVADARGFMPQKSTYFIPKAPSGMVMMPVGPA